jgi:hypothetical protein
MSIRAPQLSRRPGPSAGGSTGGSAAHSSVAANAARAPALAAKRVGTTPHRIFDKENAAGVRTARSSPADDTRILPKKLPYDGPRGAAQTRAQPRLAGAGARAADTGTLARAGVPCRIPWCGIAPLLAPATTAALLRNTLHRNTASADALAETTARILSAGSAGSALPKRPAIALLVAAAHQNHYHSLAPAASAVEASRDRLAVVPGSHHLEVGPMGATLSLVVKSRRRVTGSSPRRHFTTGAPVLPTSAPTDSHLFRAAHSRQPHRALPAHFSRKNGPGQKCYRQTERDPLDPIRGRPRQLDGSDSRRASAPADDLRTRM